MFDPIHIKNPAFSWFMPTMVKKAIINFHNKANILYSIHHLFTEGGSAFASQIEPKLIQRMMDEMIESRTTVVKNSNRFMNEWIEQSQTINDKAICMGQDCLDIVHKFSPTNVRRNSDIKQYD